ncbi:alpha,alpha-trehalose phosphorylase [Mobilisporobacter senegalensis]|uniref:Alpha,alpha-trehalose phosphorylase n=1 Tax=Mobilisporobacter senegalensis TaxID=1329262 RepID=A0A3N1XY42_9FIRM|nr:glycosyl hydrolase family 65 protein [Mobilisporobacter senegalensis]ROR31525.1 alpha,alpha-trehalose phosphorylase [Mobilisporobacter senegalensis]
MSNRQSIYEIKDLSLNNEDLILNETVFHNANGYIGVRSNFEEGYPEGFDSIRGSYINGFYDIAQMKQAEKLYGFVEEKQTMLNVVDSQSIYLFLDDEPFNMFEGTVMESSRWLNMSEGYTARRVVWRSPKGKEVEIIIKRMTSFYQLSLFTIEYSVKALNFEGNITFKSNHIGEVMNYCNPEDPRVAGESFRHLFPHSAKIIEDASFIVTHTSKSGLAVCTGVKNCLSKTGVMDVCIEEHKAICTIESNIVCNETITLTKYTVFSDSIREQDCEQKAMEEMDCALSLSLEEHYKKQREYLTDYWNQTSLEIEGDDELSLAVRYNLYQLIQSVGKDEHSNIAAKGLSGEGYEGHFFWDTEMYIQPFFTLTNPKIAKNLIEYRYSILEEARENARIMGHKKGALYPWRTINGKECSGYFPAGTAQYHINGDIAYSIVQYYLATKDMDFIAGKAGEIIFETARLWIDVGNYVNDEFHINGVTGPDEYTCMVNNNYYTNSSAKNHLNWAAKFYHLLDEFNLLKPVADKIDLSQSEIEEFKMAAEKMFLPYDEKLKINPQDDSFLQKKMWDIKNTPKEKFPLLLNYHPLHLYRYQVCKQADTVLAHFIFEDDEKIETIRNSFLYYEKVTTHDSSLSTCIYSIVASKLGMEEKAYDYFGDSAKLDLFNTHHNTKDGIHTANMGGNYMAVVYGFAGLRLKESGLFLSPSLPKKWSGYQFKVTFEQSQIKIEVTEDMCIVTLVSGDEKVIHVYGREYHLKDTISIERI